jgi:flagellar biosynthetic protein FliQ
MTPELVIQILRNALMTAFWLSAPLLLAGFVAGIVVSLVQIVTSIQDTAFNTVPRLAVFLGVLLVMMPWVMRQMMTYAASIFGDLGRYAH